jgi:flagellar motor component MotA
MDEMTTTELKKRLIRKIDKIEDDFILEEILRLVDEEEDNKEIYHLSEEQLKAVEEAEEEYRNGDFISGEEADRIIKEWLNK